MRGGIIMTLKKLTSPLVEVDPEIMEVIRELARLGHRALIVGGAVRDALLKIEPKDIDIEVYHIKCLLNNNIYVLFLAGLIV